MLFFDLLQVALGHKEQLAFVPSASEWKHLYQLLEQHSLLGIGYCAIKRLPKEQQPPEQILTDWIWQMQRVKDRNQTLTKRSTDAYSGLIRHGFDACLLKGQGNALYYGEMADYRQSGDIDIWVVPHEQPADQPRRRVIEFVQKMFPQTVLRFHHILFPIYSNAEVELHFVPVYLNNPMLNFRLKRWLESQREQQMVHRVQMNGHEVALPTVSFNALYLLLHIYKHIFEEGIGLRQLMDYYFVLQQLHTLDEAECTTLRQMLKSLRLESLAGAVMFVLHQVFAMPDEWMIVQPRRRVGLSLLSDIMQTGSFGYFDTRYEKETHGHQSSLHRYWRKTKHNLVMAYYFPHEGVWEPLFRLYHFFWRTLKLWKI